MDFSPRTDLALESAPREGTKKNERDFQIKGFSSFGIEGVEVKIKTPRGAELCKRKTGIYTTFAVGSVWNYRDTELENARNAICQKIKHLLRESGYRGESVLIAGLGNRFITSDSLGPVCIDKMGMRGSLKASLIAPGVSAQSGIESKEIIKCALKATGAKVLILIDALASRGLDRLCSTIQISNTGLCPGSGTGSAKQEISKEEMGVPIISIGVPTVVSAGNMLYDMLKSSDIENVPPCVYNSLDSYSELFVSPKDIDVIISSMSSLICDAVFLAIKDPLQKCDVLNGEFINSAKCKHRI